MGEEQGYYRPPPFGAEELEDALGDLKLQHMYWQQFVRNDEDVRYLDLQLRMNQLKFEIQLADGFFDDREERFYW